MNLLIDHTDISLEIFKHLPIDKLHQFRTVCTHWNLLLKSSFIWKYIYETQFGYSSLENMCYELHVMNNRKIINQLTNIGKVVFAINNNHINLLVQLINSGVDFRNQDIMPLLRSYCKIQTHMHKIDIK